MTLLRHRQALRRVVGVVLLALLLGQLTVLVHSTDHARVRLAAEDSAALAAVAPAEAHSDSAWGHAAGTPACQLIDHLLFGQAPGALPAALVFAPPADRGLAAPEASIGPGPVGQAYQARGPPRG